MKTLKKLLNFILNVNWTLTFANRREMGNQFSFFQEKS